MSNDPTPPIQYASVYPGPNPMPASIKVIGILCIIFGGLFVLCTPISILVMFADIPAIRNNPAFAVYKNNPGLTTWMTIQSIISMVLSLCELFGGIAAVRGRKSARPALIAYAIPTIILNIISLIVNITWVNPLLAKTVQSPAGLDPNITSFCGIILTMAMPITTLIIMTRPQVVSALQSAPQ